MIIVSDTSAITSLLQIHQEHILAELYQEVIVPTEVANELLKYHRMLPGFIKVLSITDRTRFDRLRAELDLGEAAAITLMLEGKGDLLLMDERRGRSVAMRENLPVIGLIGVLLEARKKKRIPSLADAIEQLERTADFRISPRLKARAIAAAGE